jgi:glycosyltransferase involved in cell wall biosynthesis
MNISVIIPTFNRADLLPLCLDSLVNQNYPKTNYEIIVVDNNSNDCTKEVVDKYIAKYKTVSIKYFLERTPGAGCARNTGAINAAYDILSFTDDDGILSENWLTEISEVFKSSPDIAAVAGKIVIKWDTEPPAWIKSYEWLLGSLDYGNETKYSHELYINLGNLSIKKDILLKLGGFNADQIGEKIASNGEDELNEKLWKNNYLIGWAPKAVMEHCQFVSKNATVSDIKRRYANRGVAIPYKIFISQKQVYYLLTLNLLKRIKGIFKNLFKYNYNFLNRNHEKKLLAAFLISHDCAQFPYTFKLFFNRSYRQYLLKKD